MEVEQQPSESARRSWRRYLFVIGLVAGVLLALQLVASRSPGGEQSAPANLWNSIATGDWEVKQALADLPGVDVKHAARRAIAAYEGAVPSPAAYRRIAVTRQGILRQSATADFEKIDSPEAIKLVGGADARKLSREVEMWRHIYRPGGITKAEADRFVPRVRKLNLGPLKEVAVAEVYRQAGQGAKAAAAERSARESARASVVGLGALMMALVLGGLAGLVIAVLYFSRYGPRLRAAPHPRIQASVLVLSFIVYWLGANVLGIIAGGLLALAGLGGADGLSDAAYLGVEALASLGGFALGLSVLWWLTAYTREDPREIGLRLIPARQALKWGVGGYLGALPFLGAAVVVTALLTKTIFKHVPTPEQPFQPMLATGETTAIVLVFLLASVIAPVVEETFFRGALYGALRAGLGVWPSVLLAAVVFAIVHPLPGGFLPIAVLGSALALLRESTGSLVPGMICHSLYNTITLVFVLVLV